MFKVPHSKIALLSKKAATKQDESNPKILPLRQLVHLIEENALCSCLEIVAEYLQSDDKDLCFPNISQHLEAFLIRVIKDTSNLQRLLDLFDEPSKTLVEEIINLLKEKEKVFQLNYCYESSNVRSILVYRKVYLNSAAVEAALINHFQNFPDSSVAMEPNLSTQNAAVHHHVTVILRFLRDSTRRVIEFPEMTQDESERVYALTRHRDAYSFSLFKLLWDELDVLAKTHTLKPSVLYVANDRVRLSLEKVPRVKTELEKKIRSPPKSSSKPKDKSDLNSSTDSNNAEAPKLSKAQKALDKKRKTVEVLEKAFINTTLKMIYDFIVNEVEASLVFRNATEVQCRFIQSSCSMAKNTKTHAIFPDSSKTWLRKVCQALTANTKFDLKVDVAKLQKDNKLRSVFLRKEPKELPTVSRQSRLILKIPQVRLRNVIPIRPRSLSLGGLQIDFQNGETLQPICAVVNPTPSTKPPVNLKIPQLNNPDEERPQPTDEKIKQEKVDIKKRSQSLPRSYNGEKAFDGNLRAQYNLPISTRKARLVADMSVPIESDIAMRMMQQMGWEGGPLGLRGDGITEPIMPALNLKVRAGFGHVPQDCEPITKREKQRQYASKFRCHLLQRILTLLTSDAVEHVVNYDHALTKIEKNLVTRLIGPLSNRSLAAQDEMCAEVLRPIMQVLDRQPNLKISGGLTDQKRLTLRKVLYAAKPKPLTQAALIIPPADLPTARIRQKCSELPLKLNREWNLAVGHLYNPQYAARNAVKFGHKIGVLYKILIFLRGNRREDYIQSEYQLTEKQVAHIEEVVWRVNQRAKPSYTSAIENCMVNEMLLIVRDAELDVSIETKYCVALHKVAFLPKSNCANGVIPLNNNNVINDNNVVMKVHLIEKDEDVYVDVCPHNINDEKDIKLNEKEKKLDEKEKNLDVKDNNTSVPTQSTNLESEIIALQDEILLAGSNIEGDRMSSSSSKRSLTESLNSPKTFKKTRIDDIIVYLSISKKGGEVTKEIAKNFQTFILDKLDFSNEQPLLECCGLKNGVLTYACHNEIGLLLVTGLAVEKQLEVTQVDGDVQEKHKVKFRTNLFISLDLKKLFTKIECYNFGLSTDDWVVLEVTNRDGSMEVVMEIDELSMEYICNAKFCLFAGIDKVRFTILWD